MAKNTLIVKIFTFFLVSFVFQFCGGSILTAGDLSSNENELFTETEPESHLEIIPEIFQPDADINTSENELEDLSPDIEDLQDISDNIFEDVPIPQCSDGLDNDGDSLIDLDDFDCSDPSDSVEGPDTGECTNDGHCDAGMNECNLSNNTCYDPPHGNICDSCWQSTDCGDGVTGNNPDRDFCVYWTYRGFCTKDCRGDYDCPRVFTCDLSNPVGMCLPRVGTCDTLQNFGSNCTNDNQCGGENILCHEGICTSNCSIEHDCPSGMHCTEGWCKP